MRTARSTTPPVIGETPFWRTRTFGASVAVVAVLGLVLLTRWLQDENDRRQQLRLIGENPRLAEVVATLQRLVEKPGFVPGVKSPAAVWVGRVADYKESIPIDGSAPVAILTLRHATLLAGTPAKTDSDERIDASGRPSVFQGDAPVRGDTWLIAVERDSDGRNRLHTAIRVPRQP